MRGYKKVTVMVTNVDETETITLSAERAQVGVELTATYNDLDNEGPDAAMLMWKWYLGGSEISGEDTNMHNPTRSGSLRVEASYTKTDGSIKRVSKTISVRAAPANNAAPVFPAGSDARSVDENSPPGTRVGAPVVANDARGDTLTYTLSGSGLTVVSTASTRPPVRSRWAPRATLNHEGERQTDTVTVTATDPGGMFPVTANRDDHHQRRERSSDDKRKGSLGIRSRSTTLHGNS